MISQLEQDKLRLLSLSKKMLLLAEQQKVTELEVLQNQWQPLLEEMVALHGEALEPIRYSLLEDAKQLEMILVNNQNQLNGSLLKDLKTNQTARKFLQL